MLERRTTRRRGSVIGARRYRGVTSARFGSRRFVSGHLILRVGVVVIV